MKAINEGSPWGNFSTLIITIIHQEFQVPKMEVLYWTLSGYFGVGFPLRKPYIQLI